MAKKYPGTDSSAWKVRTPQGDILKPPGKDTKPFSGYKDAAAFARTVGGTAVRV